MKSALKNGLSFLEGQQQRDGGFLSLSSSRRRDFTGEETYQSTFPASLILSALSSLPNGRSVGVIKDKLADFLLAQKSEHWSLNYWARAAKEAKTKPYPDDLDDTFCALAALTKYDGSLINGEAMAKIVTLLTAVEEEEGGPYRTWLVPEDADEEWRDVDLAVNSNVAYFLSLQEVDLPKITRLIESSIEKSEYTSRYYPLPYPVIYFISRWYRGDKVDDVRRWLLEKRYAAGSWGNPLSTALAVTSLLNFGAESGEVKQAVEYLIKNQGKDGSWPAAAFCLDPAIDKKPYYAGSAALTTAFCLEAIAGYYKRVQDSRSKKEELNVDPGADRLYREVTLEVRGALASIDDALLEPTVLTMGKVLGGDDSRQIVLLPYYFRFCLGSRAEQVPDDLIYDLSQVNLYGWVAYTIYDDFLDGEGKAPLLPVANLCLRDLTEILSRVVPDSSQFRKGVRQVLDGIEVANAWEVQHCRLNARLATGKKVVVPIPDFGDLSQLANQSLGHALGPLIILGHLGFRWDSTEVQSVLQFFKHYLIARQLNDDAHDWESDLESGQINAVGAMLLSRDLAAGKEELQQLFWNDVIKEVCDLVLLHVRSAKKSLESIDVIENKSVLGRLLESVDRSAKKALEERKQTTDFIKEYGASVR